MKANRRLEAAMKVAPIVALLGARDSQEDAVEAYCRFLAQALERIGQPMEIARVPWAEHGWSGGLRWLWRESRAWRGRWVVLQYTALQWSRRGFSFGVLAAFAILGMRRARRAVVFHDAYPWVPTRFLSRVRHRCQTFVMRSLYRSANRVIATIALGGMEWVRGPSEKAVCIPVGANLPVESASAPRPAKNGEKTVVVFSLSSGGALLHEEVEDIAHVVLGASSETLRPRLVVLGRNSELAEEPLRKLLQGRIECQVLGFLAVEEVAQTIAAADAMLFMRGEISSRRGSTIAGVVLGVPVVAYKGPETAPPITDAGVMLGPLRDRDALAGLLSRVLSEDQLAAELRRKNREATERDFSWEAIANRYVASLGLDGKIECAPDRPAERVGSLL